MTAELATCCNVVFEEDDHQEYLLYSGQSITLPPLIHPNAWKLQGTPIQFCATSLSSPALQGFEERFQTITVMEPYSGKSVDELRLEDYKLVRKRKTKRVTKPFKSSASQYSRGVTSHCWSNSSVETNDPSPMITDSSTNDAQEQPSQSSYYSTAQPMAVPSDVSHQSAEESEQVPIVTVSIGKYLMPSLLGSIIKCMQIQNCLHKLVLLELGRKTARSGGHSDTGSYRPETSHTESLEENHEGDSRDLLCELKDPLVGLMGSAEIQRSFFQRLMTLNSMSTDVSAGPSNNTSSPESSQVKMPTIRANLEEIALKTRMLCYYARNPFTSHQVKAMTSKDVLQRLCQVDGPLSSQVVNGRARGQRKLPHGHGSLKAVTGRLLYRGDWCRGMRHGKGEGFILAVPPESDSPAINEHGFYTGGWKNNMRHGHGKMTFISGAIYEGLWQYDKMSGYGTLKLPNGTIQEGIWKDGSLDGIALFTWPHGVTEYREYKHGQVFVGQLSRGQIDKETASKFSQMSYIRSQLSSLVESVTKLKDAKLDLKSQLDILRTAQAVLERNYKLEPTLSEVRQSFEIQRGKVSDELRIEFEQKFKDAEESHMKNNERISQLERELEQSRGSELCQICFERQRNCVIMPCTHLLYCRICVTEHKRKGDSRCPTCRGPICGELEVTRI